MPVTNLSRPLGRLIDLGYVPRELPLSGNQIDAWRQEGYSFLVIHELLRQHVVKYSETTVRRYIHRHFPSPVRPVMRRDEARGRGVERRLERRPRARRRHHRRGGRPDRTHPGLHPRPRPRFGHVVPGVVRTVAECRPAGVPAAKTERQRPCPRVPGAAARRYRVCWFIRSRSAALISDW